MDSLTDYLESMIEDGGPQLRGCDVEYSVRSLLTLWPMLVEAKGTVWRADVEHGGTWHLCHQQATAEQADLALVAHQVRWSSASCPGQA